MFTNFKISILSKNGKNGNFSTKVGSLGKREGEREKERERARERERDCFRSKFTQRSVLQSSIQYLVTPARRSLFMQDEMLLRKTFGSQNIQLNTPKDVIVNG